MKKKSSFSLLILKLKANIPKYLDHFKFYGTTFIDYLYYLPFSLKKISKKRGGAVVFTTEDPRVDILRYFDALKQVYDRDVILLISHSNLDELFLNAGFKAVIFFKNHWDFRRKLKKIGPIAFVHSFCRRCYLAKIVKQSFKIPTVISVKDTSVASFGLNPPRWYLRMEIPSEKYALEHSDLIIAESLEVNHASRLLGITQKSKRIYFPNYCDDKKIVSTTNKLPTDEIHLVYVGAVRGIQDRKEDHGNIQLHWLIDTLNKQKIHLHIYPSPTMRKAIYNEYFDIAKSHHYFHMHASLKPDEMIQEISQYHFGLVPFFHEDTGRAKEKRYYSSSLKIFNYIEAGLPILISEDLGHQRWIMERYGMAFKMKKEDFYKLESKVDMNSYKALIENLEKQREKLRVSGQIERVLKAYEELLENSYKA